MASRHCVAHKNQGQCLSVNGKCSVYSRGRGGTQDKGLLHQYPSSLHGLLCFPPTSLALSFLRATASVQSGSDVGVESFRMMPFTPFPFVNFRMTTDSVIQNWNRNMVQTSFG